MALGAALQKLLAEQGLNPRPLARKRDEKKADEELVAQAMADRASEVAAQFEASRNRSTSTVLARETLFLERVGATLAHVLPKGVQVQPYKPRKKKEVDRVLNLMWSDLHFHSLLDPRELPVKYGPVEEARRLAEICRQAVEYKRDHRDSTRLVINLAGDIIQNHLHDQRDGAPLAEQWSAALYLLSQAIAFLATEFKQIDLNCVPGNHGRDTSRHRERATNQKWDSLENTLYYALKQIFAKQPNIRFNIPYTAHAIYDCFGARTLVTHGDTFFRPGNPASSIDVGGITKQINAFNAQRKDAEKIGMFVVGHVHTASLVALPGKVYFMSNSALVPPDSFASSIGIYDSTCGQQMWESTPGHLVGDCRLVVVDQQTDKDQSLDKIIKPFTGF